MWRWEEWRNDFSTHGRDLDAAMKPYNELLYILMHYEERKILDMKLTPKDLMIFILKIIWFLIALHKPYRVPTYYCFFSSSLVPYSTWFSDIVYLFISHCSYTPVTNVVPSFQSLYTHLQLRRNPLRLPLLRKRLQPLPHILPRHQRDRKFFCRSFRRILHYLQSIC